MTKCHCGHDLQPLVRMNGDVDKYRVVCTDKKCRAFTYKENKK
jgi:hypothetical protein